MTVRKVWMAVLAAASVTVSGSAQDLFHLDLSGTCQGLVNGTLTSRRITQWDLIARCAGEQGLRTNNLGTNQQFDLAYNAAHALALAALRRQGYRSEKRYTVFQTLPHTLGLPTGIWRLLAKCHGLRNDWEYEGVVELDERLVVDLIAAVKAVRDAL